MAGLLERGACRGSVTAPLGFEVDGGIFTESADYKPCQSGASSLRLPWHPECFRPRGEIPLRKGKPPEKGGTQSLGSRPVARDGRAAEEREPRQRAPGPGVSAKGGSPMAATGVLGSPPVRPAAQLRLPSWGSPLLGKVSVGLGVLASVLFVAAGLALAHGGSPAGSNPAGPNPAVESLTQALVALHAQYQQATPTEQARLVGQLLTAASNRYQLLASLIEDNPGEVLRVACLLPSGPRYRPRSGRMSSRRWTLRESWRSSTRTGPDGSRYLYGLETASTRCRSISRPMRRRAPDRRAGPRTRCPRSTGCWRLRAATRACRRCRRRQCRDPW